MLEKELSLNFQLYCYKSPGRDYDVLNDFQIKNFGISLLLFKNFNLFGNKGFFITFNKLGDFSITDNACCKELNEELFTLLSLKIGCIFYDKKILNFLWEDIEEKVWDNVPLTNLIIILNNVIFYIHNQMKL